MFVASSLQSDRVSGSGRGMDLYDDYELHPLSQLSTPLFLCSQLLQDKQGERSVVQTLSDGVKVNHHGLGIYKEEKKVKWTFIN